MLHDTMQGHCPPERYDVTGSFFLNTPLSGRSQPSRAVPNPELYKGVPSRAATIGHKEEQSLVPHLAQRIGLLDELYSFLT